MCDLVSTLYPHKQTCETKRPFEAYSSPRLHVSVLKEKSLSIWIKSSPGCCYEALYLCLPISLNYSSLKK